MVKMDFQKALAIIEQAIKEQKKVSSVCKEHGLEPSAVSKYIYEVANDRRVSLPKHSKDRLLIRYNQAMHIAKDLGDMDLDRAKSYIIKKRNEAVSLIEVSNFLGRSPNQTEKILELLKQEGFSVTVKTSSDTTVVFQENEVSDLSIAETHLFGVLGDTHLGSKYARLDLLHQTYKRFKELGVTTVFHTGNWIDGEAKFNFNDLIIHGMDNQLDYLIENYPKVDGITTYYISGDDHESWYSNKVGVNIGKYLEIKAHKAGRHDLVFLGHMEADVMLGKTKVRVLHPGGGSAYAISYTSQKIVESYSETEKPDILLHGHYHKFEYLFLRGIHVFQTGCLQEQTPFMRKKRISSHLGAWVIEFTPNEEGKIVEMLQRPIVYPHSKWEYKE